MVDRIGRWVTSGAAGVRRQLSLAAGVPRVGSLAAMQLVVAALGASAASIELPATVIAVRQDRVYLALSQPMAVETGQPIRFFDGEHPVATAVITRVYDDELAVAIVSSGSFADVPRLERLRVVIDSQPVPARALRLGYPSSRRVNLIFGCGTLRLASWVEEFGYRALSAADPYRLVRDPSVPLEAPWPDTLVIRLFDDSADEEIALERGELDVAVFWPGELSRHMRETPRFQDPLLGRRSHGVIATRPAEGLSPELDSLNRQVFHGDLAPLSPPIVGPRRSARFLVDRSWPGHQEVERHLNRTSSSSRTIRLLYLDGPAAAADSVATNRAGSIGPVFGIRCPLVCAPEGRAYAQALGPDRLADLFACGPIRR